MRGPRRLHASWVAAGLLGFAAGLAAGGTDERPDYRELVERYARGERGSAVAALGWVADQQLDAQRAAVQSALRRSERCASCPTPFDQFPLRAAVMLHVDREEAERPSASVVEQEQWHPCAGRHSELASLYAELLASRPEGRDFARRFFLAEAQRWQWEGCPEDALRQASEGLKRFRGDAELLLAVGSIFEEAATLQEFPLPPLRSSSQSALSERARTIAVERERRFKEARRFLTDALLSYPGFALARLRLGRVLWRLGDRPAARAALEQALEENGDREVVYLAHLFLGQVDEDDDRLEEAIAEYRRALDVDPHAQSAAVALSHALRLAGDTQASRDVLKHALARARQRSADAYWNYLSSPAARAEELFAQLREETRR